MTPKLIGCCSKCDAEVFDIVKRDEDRKPIQVGPAHDDAVRVTFRLAAGPYMDLTFCKPCSDGLTPDDYPFLWQRVMLSWVDQTGSEHPWPKSQVDNTILGLTHRQLWKEI